MSSTYKIPIVNLRAQYAGIRAEVLAAVDEVLESQQFILGPAVSRFEEQMARYLGCAHAAGVALGQRCVATRADGLGYRSWRRCRRHAVHFFFTVSSITIREFFRA